MVHSKIYTVAKIFNGPIKEDDLKLEEEELRPIEDGGKFHFIINSVN